MTFIVLLLLGLALMRGETPTVLTEISAKFIVDRLRQVLLQETEHIAVLAAKDSKLLVSMFAPLYALWHWFGGHTSGNWVRQSCTRVRTWFARRRLHRIEVLRQAADATLICNGESAMMTLDLHALSWLALREP